MASLDAKGIVSLVFAISVLLFVLAWRTPEEARRIRRLVWLRIAGARDEATSVAEFVERLMPGLSRRFGLIEGARARLERAGAPYGLSVDSYLLLQGAVGLLAVLLLSLAAVAAGGTPPVLALAAGAAAGWKLPDLWLETRARVRQAAILAQLPAVLDLLVICAESGMGLIAALDIVSRRGAGTLGTEIARALREIAVGKRPADALRDMARRVDVPALSATVTALLRGEQLGLPVAEVLRSQAAQARTHLRRQAEARIGAMPMKLTLCTVAFILPIVFAIVILPNVLAFLSTEW